MDKHSKEQRRKNMQAVKAKGSKIESKLQKALWEKGYRYRKNYNKIDGKPDIVFVSLKIAIFCDSEFWHGKDWENKKKEIKSNKKFWHDKIERNIERDREVNELLTKKGWKVLRFWGREIEKNIETCIHLIELEINESKSKEIL